MKRRRWPRHPIALALVAGLAGGCAVGPNFNRPSAPEGAYTRGPPVAPIGGDQTFVQGMDVSARWWSGFGSPALDALMDRALKANPDLAAARAALRSARETYLAQRGALFPTVDADYTVTRQKAPDIPASPLQDNNNLFTLHTAQVTVSYIPDVFGGIRRQTETAKAQAESQRFETEAAYLTLTTNVAATAIQAASLAEQIAATRQVIEAETKVLNAFRRQQDLGQASGLDVAAQESALAQVEAALPPLERQLAQQRDSLAYLTGRTPGEVTDPPIVMSELKLPAELPVSLPSKLVDQRPDIRAAEANLHAATAQVGVAIAARLPVINLTADAGGTSTVLSNLFAKGNGFWGLTGEVSQPIFEGGTLLHRQRAARANLDQAREQYRAAVLGAFQNVADTLQALQADARALAAARRAETSAESALAITRKQLERGQVNGPTVLLAEQAYQQAVVGRLQAQASRYADTVALFQALGGGWWNRKDV